MLLPSKLWDRITSGEITVAFRRWVRPTVKSGGFLQSGAGRLAIDAVEVIELAEITDRDATAAGYQDRTQVITELQQREEGRYYRIRFRVSGPDPRIALRAQAELSPEDRQALEKKLAGLDRRSPRGPWTRATLEQIGRHPEVRAADLAAQVGMVTELYKRDVRKLKALGLTESLEVGYRLSPRGRALLL